MKYQGIIFDLDGVLCSTDEYHYQAWKEIADKHHIPFNREDNNRLRGVSRMASLELILEKSPATYSAEEKEQMATEKNEIYRTLLLRMSKRDLNPEVTRCLLALREAGMKMAIGSSSRNTPIILERLGLHEFFDAVVDGNQITHSKPDPEVFIKAAQQLGLDPDQCLVVEDAIAGEQAGHAGGFHVACLGDASKAGVGDYNMMRISELTEIAR